MTRFEEKQTIRTLVMTLTIRTLVNTEHLIACGLFGLKSVIILDHFVKKSLVNSEQRYYMYHFNCARSSFSDMISKVIKLKLQYFKHVNVQVTCQRDPEVYAACHDHKIYLHTKFGIPTSNCIQICSGLDLARTKTRGQGHSKLETVGDSPGPKTYLHTKYGTATIHK